MTFNTKLEPPVARFGEHAGVPVRDWPEHYLIKMADLAKHGRIMDKDLSRHIIDVHNRRYNNEER